MIYVKAFSNTFLSLTLSAANIEIEGKLDTFSQYSRKSLFSIKTKLKQGILNFRLKWFQVFCIFEHFEWENKWKINTRRCIDFKKEKLIVQREKNYTRILITKRLLFDTFISSCLRMNVDEKSLLSLVESKKHKSQVEITIKFVGFAVPMIIFCSSLSLNASRKDSKINLKT